MNTNQNNRAARCRRISTCAAAMLVASAFAAAAPATAAPDSFIALAVGDLNDAPPVQTAGGSSIGPDVNQAGQAALTACVNNGGGHCVVEVTAQNACAAVASNDYGEFEGASDPSLKAAQGNATAKLQSQQGAHLVTSGCANTPTQPTPPAPVKLGPTVAFTPILGGLEADITDRSGATSQCTYAMDNLNRSFALPASSTYDLKIVPAIPRFKNTTVNITCDNGTSTKATTKF